MHSSDRQSKIVPLHSISLLILGRLTPCHSNLNSETSLKSPFEVGLNMTHPRNSRTVHATVRIPACKPKKAWPWPQNRDPPGPHTGIRNASRAAYGTVQSHVLRTFFLPLLIEDAHPLSSRFTEKVSLRRVSQAL